MKKSKNKSRHLTALIFTEYFLGTGIRIRIYALSIPLASLVIDDIKYCRTEKTRLKVKLPCFLCIKKRYQE